MKQNLAIILAVLSFVLPMNTWSQDSEPSLVSKREDGIPGCPAFEGLKIDGDKVSTYAKIVSSENRQKCLEGKKSFTLEWTIPQGKRAAQLTGDCYVQSGMAALESLITRHTGQRIDLSEEFATCGAQADELTYKLDDRFSALVNKFKQTYTLLTAGHPASGGFPWLFMRFILKKPRYIVKKFDISKEDYAKIGKRILDNKYLRYDDVLKCFQGRCAIKPRLPFKLHTNRLRIRAILGPTGTVVEDPKGWKRFDDDNDKKEKIIENLNAGYHDRIQRIRKLKSDYLNETDDILSVLVSGGSYLESLRTSVKQLKWKNLKTFVATKLVGKQKLVWERKVARRVRRMVKRNFRIREIAGDLIKQYPNNKDLAIALYKKTQEMAKAILNKKNRFELLRDHYETTSRSNHLNWGVGIRKPLDQKITEQCRKESKSLVKKLQKNLCDGHPVISAFFLDSALTGDTFDSALRIKDKRASLRHAALLVGIERTPMGEYWKFLDSNANKFIWFPVAETCRFLSAHVLETKK